MTDIRGQSVLVTGAGSGLGKQIALAAAERGARLILWDIDAAKVEATRAALPVVGTVTHHAATCNVADEASVQEIAEKLIAEHGCPDVIINNAGVVSGKSFLDSSPADFRRTLEVNALGPMLVTRAFLPIMVRRDAGHLVTIASVAALGGVGGMVDYSASKWAAMGFDESLRRELRRLAPNIQTTVICPYFINTGMFTGAKARFHWLLPMLREERVAARVLTAITKNHAQVVMPPLMRISFLMRYLPVRWLDAYTDLLGFNRAMDTFTGRPATKALDEPPPS